MRCFATKSTGANVLMLPTELCVVRKNDMKYDFGCFTTSARPGNWRNYRPLATLILEFLQLVGVAFQDG